MNFCIRLGMGILLLGVFLLHAAEIDVTRFGARGDGVADDSAAIRAAVAELKKNGGGTLRFPAGRYRIATPGPGGIFLDGISNAVICFDPEAVLLMDNLLPDGSGGGHGVTVRGPARNIELRNVKVVWKNKPKVRSNGDGFRLGYPDPLRTLAQIRMVNCEVGKSAQTGAVFMGCSNVTVRDFTVRESWADGLHFNACSNIEVDGVTGIRTGDDALAFVTYYAEKFEGETGTVFSLPELGAWSNSGASAKRIRVQGGNANGIRIAGSKFISISDVEVEDKVGCGIIIDAGPLTAVNHWQYLASRDISIRDVTVKGSNTGLYIMQFDPVTDNPAFSRFDVQCVTFRIENCSNDSVHLSGVSGVRLRDFVTSGCRWRFRTFTDCRVDNATIDAGTFLLIGRDETGDPARLGELRNSDSRITGVRIRNGNLVIQRCRNFEAQDVGISGSGGSALTLFQTLDSRISRLKIKDANLSGSVPFAIQVLQSRGIHFEDVDVTGSGSLKAAFELGGGDDRFTTDRISIGGLQLVPSSIPPVFAQSGPYGVKNWKFGPSDGSLSPR
ncbi:glycosyl hydrolase family 28-related protein [uncultured Victivallis sp.]|uniref:right-handed parallel beta-helix repeat-containing protein n=1 Tax=uncultured Victivallis sp. TaxID=354118 RepID=UPI0025F617EA|nr:glycosyl hydrolase family 28-related protein [uncultured Victivallis sp.]